MGARVRAAVLLSVAAFGLLSLIQLNDAAVKVDTSRAGGGAQPRRSGLFPEALLHAGSGAPPPLLLRTEQAGAAAREPPPPGPRADDALWRERRAAAVAAIAHAFDGYAAHAWGFDELQPLSKGGKNTFCGAGATIVDSLSTLWLANLTERFERAAAWALARDYGSTLRDCNLFETNIRIVGGLLSAGALSGRPAFYDQAEVIVRLMLPSFATPSGVPCNSFPRAAPGCGTANLAEVGTLQMEFLFLSHVKEKPEYGAAAERVIRSLALARNASSACALEGLYASTISTADGSMSGCSASVGGGNDSFYEYLLKIWLLVNEHPSFASYKRMWDLHAQGALRHLVRCSAGGHVFVTSAGGHSNNLEHLACYFPANLMLGDAAKFEAVAGGITESCAAMYTATHSRLGADGVTWNGPRALATCLDAPRTHDDAPATGDMQVTGGGNLQRPEAVEALFHMWHFTQDSYWRDVGWEMFAAMDAKTRVPGAGYASVVNVQSDPVVLEDTQQSFFIAEELKYFLLLFSGRNEVLDMDRWVFNTEAHPLPRFTPRANSTLGDVCTNAPLVCAPLAASSGGVGRAQQ
jgi:mannosyl-oligosaccharide alpha-1,2-mannosidase